MLFHKEFGTSFENSILDIEELENEEKPKILNKSLLRSEEDVRAKIINPYLETLGFDLDEETFHEESIKFTMGTREYQLSLLGRSDTIININNYNIMVVEAKKYDHALTRKDWEELRSFVHALVDDEERIPRYGVLTNGHKWAIRDFYKREWIKKVPTHRDILANFSMNEILISDYEKDFAIKKAYTQASEEKLINIISKTEEYLRNEGYDGQKAFLELSKLLVTKINEDKRFFEGNICRFERNTIKNYQNIVTKSVNEILNEFFNEAKNTFMGIFDDNDSILINSEDTLLNIVDLFEPFILYRLDFDLFGIVYEKFFADIFKGETGKYFTPREIVEFMVDLADIEIGEIVCDPSCGSGGFLTRAYSNLRAQVSDIIGDEEDIGEHELVKFIESKCIVGNDIDPNLVKLTKINMVIHGDGWNHIYQSDVFEIENSPLTQWHENIDVILANPPFSIKVSDKEKLKNFTFGRDKEESVSDLLFVERCYNLLRPGGRMLIVLPSGWANNSDDQYFRDYLYANWIELATISLPEGLFKPFGESGAKTVIFYLKKPLNSDDKQGDVLKINIAHVGYDHTSKKYKKIPQNDLNTVLQIDDFIRFKNSIYFDRTGDSHYTEMRKRVNDYAN